MKQMLINDVVQGMLPYLDNGQIEELQKVLKHALFKVEIQEKTPLKAKESVDENNKLVELFLSAKRIEGCSEKSLNYYQKTIKTMLEKSKDITFAENNVHIKSALNDERREQIKNLANELCK